MFILLKMVFPVINSMKEIGMVDEAMELLQIMNIFNKEKTASEENIKQSIQNFLVQDNLYLQYSFLKIDLQVKLHIDIEKTKKELEIWNKKFLVSLYPAQIWKNNESGKVT